MEKIDAVLVVLKHEVLEETLKNLNGDNVNIVAVLTDRSKEEFESDTSSLPYEDFSNIKDVLGKYKNSLWLISGYVKSATEISKMKEFLMLNDVPEGNIINFDLSRHVNKTWLANLRYIEKNGADFFATGDEYIQCGLNFKFIPCVFADKNIAKGGVNLSYPTQDLQQSYLIAKYVFKYVKPGTIKFVLIGLTPDSFRYDNAADFSNSKVQDARFKILVSDEAKKIFATITAEDADLNFDAIKAKFNREFSLEAVTTWEDSSKLFSDDAVEKNVKILKYYIKLCEDNGAKPVGVIFPFSPAAQKTYDKELMTNFRGIIHELEENSEFIFFDYFNQLNYDCFCDMTHLNSKGMMFSSQMLALKLHKENLIPTESFLAMTYEYFVDLSRIAPKAEYNLLMDSIFEVAAQMIRRKDKIKVGFVMIESAHWAGDDLYNFFAQNKRFETTVFLCMDFHKDRNALVKKDFWRGVEQLKSTGVNVVSLDRKNASSPEQDVLIFLTPYIQWLPTTFRLTNIKAQTLLTHIPYGFDSSFHVNGFYNQRIFIVAWKVFFSSVITFELYKNKNRIGAPRGLYSGYPKIDIFFKNDSNINFDWKMAHHDAKKIIWAPHHSIKGSPSVKYATFQWNYKFMYEFAKAHLEISWVVKPHPWLLYTAVKEKVFPSSEALNEYFQKWNELPNAQVYTGGYYQAIFATSDGMIHDCGSFIAEYQFVDKPMIYLTRDVQRHNKLGKEILRVSYLVDGKDLDGIAATIERVFIEGKDDKAPNRKKVFDKYLNYPKYNGMLASEFIYKSIADELN